MLRRASVVTDDFDRLGRNVVILILARLFFERLDEDLQILLGNLSGRALVSAL